MKNIIPCIVFMAVLVAIAPRAHALGWVYLKPVLAIQTGQTVVWRMTTTITPTPAILRRVLCRTGAAGSLSRWPLRSCAIKSKCTATMVKATWIMFRWMCIIQAQAHGRRCIQVRSMMPRGTLPRFSLPAQSPKCASGITFTLTSILCGSVSPFRIARPWLPHRRSRL